MDLDSLKYSPDHLWVKLDDDDQVTVGLTEEMLKKYNEVTKLKLPKEGDELIKDEPFGTLRPRGFRGPRGTGGSGNLRLLAPLSGEVLAVNEDLVDAPEALHDDPYEEGWLIRMEFAVRGEFDDLMTREEYEDFLAEEFDDEYGDDDDDDEDDDEDDEDDDDDEEEEEEDYYYDDEDDDV